MLLWWVTDNWKCYSNVLLKRLWWRVTEKAMMTGDRSLKRLLWHELKWIPWQVTEKPTLTCNWKGYDGGWQITEKDIVTCTENATLTWTKNASFTELYMKLLSGSVGYKSTSRERKLRRIHTHRPHTMGCKESEPWSSRWVRQKLREANNGLPPNGPNHDEKHPTDAEKPLCKCDLDCQSHMCLDHDTYGMRYWSCPFLSSPFN
jgi:hypothetical protein